VNACPWGVAKFDAVEQLAYKCNLCYDRRIARPEAQTRVADLRRKGRDTL
jgi:Fe-S-cluster-containing dehydrogenase component